MARSGRNLDAVGAALLALVLVVLLVAPAAHAVPAPGAQVWANWLDGSAHAADAIVDVARAPDGSLYAAGVANDDWASGADLLLVRTRPGGPTVPGAWTRSWNGPAAGADYFADLVVDRWSNAIVVGTTSTATQMEDWAVVKRSPAGKLLWARTWGGSAHLSDWASAAVCDAAGNVYVCGSATVSATRQDWKVVKFRAGNGSVAWVAIYSSPAAEHKGDEAKALAIDAAGDLYVTGVSLNKAGDEDMLVLKLSAAGTRRWARRIDGASHLGDRGLAIALPASGALWVAGDTWVQPGQSGLLLSRITRSGRYVWSSRTRSWRDQAIGGFHFVSGLALDGGGNAYIAGYSWDSAGRGFLQKWSPSGSRRWTRTYLPAGVETSAFYGLTVDTKGQAWVVGMAKPAGGSRDWLAARYSPSGARAWVSTCDTPTFHLDDWANAATLSGTGGLFVGGVMGTATNDDAGVAGYVR